MKANLKVIETGNIVSPDSLSKTEIIGRDASEKRQRRVPVFPDASKREVRFGSLGDILNKQAK